MDPLKAPAPWGDPRTPISAPQWDPRPNRRELRVRAQRNGSCPPLYPPGPLGGQTPPQNPLQVLGSISASVGKGSGCDVGAPCAPQAGAPAVQRRLPSNRSATRAGCGGDALPSPGSGCAGVGVPLQMGDVVPAQPPVPSEVGEVLDETQLQHPLDGHRLV